MGLEASAACPVQAKPELHHLPHTSGARASLGPMHHGKTTTRVYTGPKQRVFEVNFKLGKAFI